MTCLTHLSSYTAALLTRTNIFVAKRCLYRYLACSWETKLKNPGLNIGSEFWPGRLSTRCYSTKKGRKSASKSLKVEPEHGIEKGKEKDAFFLVRKGDVVGVYKSLTECQDQVGASISDPPLSVYKGISLTEDAEEYLACCGLKNALYTIRAADLNEDLFGSLEPCTFLDPTSNARDTDTDASRKRLEDGSGPEKEGVSLALISEDPSSKHSKLDYSAVEATSSDIQTCILEYDGASKGNPGKAGAGAILRTTDGKVICRLREGLGVATNNAAEYRAIILGLRHALVKGFTNIHVQGDSRLVCMQVQGLWKTKNDKISILHKEAKKLKDKFISFKISHVLRKSNSEADLQANLALHLADGQVEEELGD